MDFCWNLGFDGDINRKLLRERLNTYLHTSRLSFNIKDSEGKTFNIKYIENKNIKGSSFCYTVYDLVQFFHRSSLAKAYTDIISS